MVGSAISHYRILGQLGSGGMGTVYHALDTELGRAVAIKFLRPELALQPGRKERFLKEARAAAALSHPHICTIHEVGRLNEDLFIVMQLIEGRTLAEAIAGGPLDPDTVRRVASQLAAALGEAHSRGIVHRDLKPSNIMLRRNHDVTVLDFGLAAMLGEDLRLDDLSTATNRLSIQSARAMGTIGYMAPEQIRGEAVDAASDVFALGATLYEVATGRNPFRRTGVMQTIAAVLDDNPVPIRSAVRAFPEDLEAIILRCLEKRAQLRYPDGNAVLDELRGASEPRTSSLPTVRHRSLAVLPFASHTEQDDQYLAEGLTTEIITKLARLRGVRVISRSTIHRYRNSTLDARQIGQELDVEAVLEGSITKRGDRCRVMVQLLEVKTGFCLWADRYEFTVGDLFMIQDTVSERISRALKTRFRGATRHRMRGEATAAAHQLYLKGKALFYRFNSTDNLLAIEAFHRALNLDEHYAEAQAGLASACMARLEREWERDEARWIAEASKASDQAIAQDPWISEAYSARGLVFLRQQRLDQAEAEFRRALAINANDDIAHAMIGRIRFERGDLLLAARAYTRALKISPDYVWCWNDLAWVQWLLGRYDETERALARALAINPVDEIARVGLATGAYFKGEIDAAVEAARKAVEINPNHPFPRPVLAVALARRGQSSEALAVCRAVLAERPKDFLASAAIAVVHAILGDMDHLREANAKALTIEAGRAPLNLNVAVHFAFLNHGEYARLWLAKSIREGLRPSIALTHNPLLRPYAAEFVDGRPRTEFRR